MRRWWRRLREEEDDDDDDDDDDERCTGKISFERKDTFDLFSLELATYLLAVHLSILRIDIHNDEE